MNEVIDICEHITIIGDLIFDNKKEAMDDVKNYRAYMSTFSAKCKVCKTKKNIYQTHNV